MLILGIALLMVFLSFKDLFTYGYFYANRDFITQAFCINLDKPELKCDGKCFLKKKIKEAKETEENAPYSLEDNRISVVYLPTESIYFRISHELNFKKRITHHYKNNYSHSYSNSIFQPPKFC